MRTKQVVGAAPPEALQRTVGTQRSDSRSRLVWLDGLRGFAILGVLLVHSAHPFPSVGNIPYTLLLAGRFGVDLFFVISGFVLYHTFNGLRQTCDSPRRTFLFRRWMRLAPVYYAGIVLYGVVLRLLSEHSLASFGEVIWNISFLNGWVPGQANATVPGGWSISTEAAFALLFMGIVPLLSTLRSTLIVAVLAWLISRASGDWVEAALRQASFGKAFGSDSIYIPWRHLPTFLFGVCCWHVWQSYLSSEDGPAKAWKQMIYLITGAVLIVLLAFEAYGARDRVLYAGGGAVLLLLACSEGGLPQRLCRSLAGLGRISFGVYLFHFAFLELAKSASVMILPIGSPSILLILMTLLVTSLGAIPLAILSWVYFERPIHVWATKGGGGHRKQLRTE